LQPAVAATACRRPPGAPLPLFDPLPSRTSILLGRVDGDGGHGGVPRGSPTAMVIAYALVALATVKVWGAVTYGEGRHEDRPERIVSEAAGGTRKRRCPRSVRRPPMRGGARCLRRRR